MIDIDRKIKKQEKETINMKNIDR